MSKARLAWLGLAALAAWHLALRWRGLDLPMIVDEGEYACAARAWSQGGVPYRDSYSQKPPMTLWLYRGAYAAFPDRPLAARALAVAFSWLTMLLLFLLVPSGYGLAARLAAPGAYAVLSTSPIGTLGFAANTEVFLGAFMALSALALTRGLKGGGRWLLLAGLAAGAAVMTKQTAVWTAAAFLLLAAGPGLGWKGGLLFGAGAAAVPSAWAAYFACRGALGDFWQDAFLRNLDYVSVVARTASAGAQWRWLASSVAPLFLIGDWPAYALAVFGLGSARARWRDPRTVTALWLGTSVIGAMTGQFFFPYYFLQAAAPLALAAAEGAQRLEGAGRKRGRAWLALAALCVYPVLARLGPYFLYAPETLAKRLLYPNPLFESIALADYIRGHSADSDSMYIFGSEAQIYVYARRKPATSHVLSYPLTLFPKDAAAGARELAQVDAARPRFIVYSAQPGSTIVASRLGEDFRAGVQALLRRQYRWVGEAVVRPDASALRFSEAGLGKEPPDWSADTSLFLFERRGR